ncbi:MAG TPA: cysteine hydrolase [Mucilaginibacter sp.]|nr:cysteine hydrolase [Mucilaginibacter sp.]
MTNNSKNSKTVLLVMDIQKAMMGYLPDPEPLLTKIEKAIISARKAGVTVVYVTLAFREGHPEIHLEHRRFATIKESKVMFTHAHEGTAVHPAIEPLPTDIIVSKKRVSAFAGSDLEIILRAHKAESLVLSGFSTSGVVLSTLLEASDRDYRMTILSDACADPEPEVHDFLVKKIFPSSGEVLTTDEWVAALN